MRLIHTAPLAAAFLLAACGGDADTDEDGAVSGEAIAEAADAITLQPGQYRTTYEMLEFNVPGAPDAVKDQMQAMMGGAAEVAAPATYCFTPEQAAENGAEQMAKKMAEGNCTVARFDASGDGRTVVFASDSEAMGAPPPELDDADVQIFSRRIGR